VASEVGDDRAGLTAASAISAPRFLLVTGTDTGVGKTLVVCALAGALARRGRRVLAVKPVETGCAGTVAEEEDGVRLAAASGQRSPGAALTRLRAPLAPPVAAEAEGVQLRPAEWERELARLGAGQELVLVEGAGGLLSPLAWGYDARRLARALDAAVLVVAADRLGALNHCLLTLEALRRERVPVLGVVLSATATADAASGSNVAALTRCGVARVAMLPRVGAVADAGERLGAVVGWVEEWLVAGEVRA
jgi:dethiobiotin synthase